MTAVTVTMTWDEAADLRAAYGAQVARLNAKSNAKLAAEERDLGMERLFGTLSHDELVSSVLSLLGFGAKRLNEATHVLAHQPGETWRACEWCACQVTWTDGDGFLQQCSLAPDHSGRCLP